MDELLLGPPRVELVEELANGVEDELHVERHVDAMKLRKTDRGTKLENRMNPIPIVSTLLRRTHNSSI